MFNGEEIIKLRLEYLSPYVDKFFICEQRYTHQGTRKDALFLDVHKDWFEPYKSKVVLLVDERIPMGGTWDMENSHRNYCMPWLFAEEGPWICSVCDVDEIPDYNAVLQERQKLYEVCLSGPVYMQQQKLYYNLNWFVDVWRFPFFVSDGLITKGNTLQDFRSKKTQQIGGLLQCGWHLSYFMSAAEIQRKLKSFAHSEHNIPEITNLQNIQDCIENGIDLFKRYPEQFKKMPLESFPQVFQEFHARLVKQQKA